MNKILITGAAGNLGRATIDHLLKKTSPGNIVAFVRNDDGDNAAFYREKGVDVKVGEYDDIDSIDNAMQGVEKVLLISGADINRFKQQSNVIDAAKRAGAKYIAYTGVSLKNPDTSAVKMFMDAHFQTEDYIKESGLSYTFLRNSLYAEVIPMYVGEQVFETGIFFPAGNGKAAYALRREMGEAAANVLTDAGHTNKTYEISGGTLYSYQDVAAELSAISGKTVNYTDADPAVFSDRLKEFSVPADYVVLIAGFAEDIKNGQYEIATNDLESILGRKPATLSESLKEIYGK